MGSLQGLRCLAHHIDAPLIHQDPGADQEGKHELVLLKEAAAHVAVQTEGDVVVDVLHPLCQLL